MKRVYMTVAAAAFGAAAYLSPIFGQAGALVSSQARHEHSQRFMRRRVKRMKAWNARKPHQGKKECAKRVGFGQYPEYTALRAKNVASGKWSPNVGA